MQRPKRGARGKTTGRPFSRSTPTSASTPWLIIVLLIVFAAETITIAAGGLEPHCDSEFVLDLMPLPDQTVDQVAVGLFLRRADDECNRVYAAIEVAGNLWFMPEGRQRIDHVVVCFDRCQDYRWPIITLDAAFSRGGAPLRFIAAMTDESGERILETSVFPEVRIIN